ncbi:hypothetical protein sos41_33720 [Alphaproteobacteria bacterium SO-S41]|nr:hypothetical protein sos41_33720 [Alphaproteobacteria bacterium SO-S41]
MRSLHSLGMALETVDADRAFPIDDAPPVAMAPTVSFTAEQAAAQLTRGGYTWQAQMGQPVTVTYAYRFSAPTTMPDDTGGFSQFNGAQVLAAEAALRAWSDVAQITFTRVSGLGVNGNYSNNATILFGNYSTGGDDAAGFAFLPNPNAKGAGSIAGDVWINATLNYNTGPIGTYGAAVLIHEIGHAIGLEHPGDYDAGDDTEPTYNDAVYREDDRQYTVMSYFSETNTGANFQGKYAAAPMLHDIYALQRLYGASTTTLLGDTIYGVGSNTGRTWLSSKLDSVKLIFAVWDNGGIDTFNFSFYEADQRIDLRPGAFSDVGGLIGNVVIPYEVAIENAMGGLGSDRIDGNNLDNVLWGNGGNDTLDGHEGNDELRGGAGADRLIGGTGTDTVTYSEATAGVVAFLLSPSSNSGFAAGDLYDSIENLIGTSFGDILGGSDTANVISGLVGNDYLYGAEGDDTLIGGAGADRLEGQGGNDTASYAGAAAGVTSFLGGAFLNTGEAAGDSYFSIENIMGSAFADLLVGDGGNNIVNGGAGNDFVFGGIGADSLFGGAGDDQVQGGPGADVIDGGDGNDIASYSEAAAGMVVFMLAPQASTGDGQGDTFFSIEGVTGSVFGDILGGTEGNNTIVGGGGNDYVFAAGGDDIIDGGPGSDQMEGQGGFDFVTYRSATAGVSAYLATPQLNTGDAAGDTYAGIEGLLGSYYNDVMAGDAFDNIVQGLAGNDTLYGGAGNDYVVGDEGDDVLEGGAGADVLDGGFGLDVASYAGASSGVTVNLANTALNKGEAAGDIYRAIDFILGSAFADVLVGDANDNRLAGGAGADTLTGGAGADFFTFLAVSDGGDTITDFRFGTDQFLATDRLNFASNAFGLPVGVLDPSHFFSGTNPSASASGPAFLFNTTTHQLFYDVDGNGGQAAVLMATLSNGQNLNSTDIWLV